MHVPVEISRRDGRTRWYRLSVDVSAEAVWLAHVVPEALDGPLGVAFHLPGDPVPVRCGGHAVEEVVGEGEDEHAERSAVRFVDLEESSRARIANYVTERLGLS
jgi:hypothetical protein